MWQKTTVKRILKNTAYKGILYIRRYDTVGVKLNKYKSPEEHVKRKEKPMDEWQGIEVPVITDERTWQAAQDSLKNANRKWRSYSKSEYLLSTKIRCGLCNGTVHGNLVTNRNNKKYRYYVCSNRVANHSMPIHCELGSVNADIVEEIVWDKIVSWLKDPDLIEQEFYSKAQHIEDINKEEYSLLQRELDNINKERERLITMFQKGHIIESEFEIRIKDVRNREHVIKSKIKNVEEIIQRRNLQEDEINKIKELSKRYLYTIDHLNFDQKKDIINTIIDEVIISHDTIVIKARVPLEPKTLHMNT
ncbi:MAG: hypothetical protein A2Y23_14610 [Clostridiales bacterium GWB2_37_7]|nr:MAG: hypothetical protein A2Y23_14610 [Clostridiales bacterium GWB2_37_7]